MDVLRTPKSHYRRHLRLTIYVAAAVGLVLAITIALARLKPAAPAANRNAVWIDTVKRGPMLRQVRGSGSLIPESVRVIAASTEGRIERVLVQPGVEVTAGTVLAELSNPELEQAARDAEFQVRAGEADFKNLQARLESERMNQQAASATVRAEFQRAKLQADTDATLAKEGLIPALNLKLSKVHAEELATRYDIEQRRVEASGKSDGAQLAAQQARLEQLRELAHLRRRQVGELVVRAGTGGVLQQIQMEVGQQVTPGTNLAKVVEPQRLKAELKVAETQAKDVVIGQRVQIDTRNGVIPGRVVRIDPAVREGTVTVDVALEGQLPQGARPDLSVDGTIELERLSNVLYVGRPSSGQGQGEVSLFKLEPGGDAAVRVRVKLGRNSVNVVEVLEGLHEGDQVILSDSTAWDATDRVSLK
jgi:HlyD family secretion protein